MVWPFFWFLKNITKIIKKRHACPALLKRPASPLSPNSSLFFSKILVSFCFSFIFLVFKLILVNQSFQLNSTTTKQMFESVIKEFMKNLTTQVLSKNPSNIGLNSRMYSIWYSISKMKHICKMYAKLSEHYQIYFSFSCRNFLIDCNFRTKKEVMHQKHR